MLRNLARAARARARSHDTTAPLGEAARQADESRARPPEEDDARGGRRAAAAAKAQQRLVDTESRLFGGGVGATHPFVLTLLAACVGLHFYNADLQTKREEEEELLERLRARRRARPLSADELDHALARKRRLLDIGEGDAADAARLSEEHRGAPRPSGVTTGILRGMMSFRVGHVRVRVAS